jgi:hypothetical protein
MIMTDQVSEITAKAFEGALLLGLSTVDTSYTMHNDYDPQDEVLEVAADFSGVSHRLPWKTRMKFEDNGVQVKCGYGANYEEILNK